MPKKKATASGFGLLMKEQQEILANKGQRVPMAQMKNYAEPIWKAMSAEEKQDYNTKAKLSRRLGDTDKLAADGTSIQTNMTIMMESERKVSQMALDIRELVGSFDKDPKEFIANNLNHRFYVISFNILCCTNDGEFVPLEVAIVEYSIQKGIMRYYHNFIYPGPVPVGLRGEAIRHSEDTHKIPVSGHESSEKNYGQILRDIANFLCPTDKNFPPLFCLSDVMEQAESCLTWLCKKIGTENYANVWDISVLLYELRKGSGSAVPSKFIAEEMMRKNSFDYTVDSRCPFHEELDSAYCALNCSRRLCYLLSDCLCGSFEIVVTDKHLPQRDEETKQYEILCPTGRLAANFTAPSSFSKPSASSRLDEIEGFSDDDDDSSDKACAPRSLVSDMEKLKLNASATVPSQGLGRGKRRT